MKNDKDFAQFATQVAERLGRDVDDEGALD